KNQPTSKAQEWRVLQWKDKMSGRLRDSWDLYEGNTLLAGDMFEQEATRLADAHNAAIAAEREKRIEAERERDEFSKGCDNLAAKLSYERLKQSSETRGLQS